MVDLAQYETVWTTFSLLLTCSFLRGEVWQAITKSLLRMLLAFLYAYWLLGGTPTADNLRDGIAVNVMCEVLLVVAQSTRVHLATARSLNTDRQYPNQEYWVCILRISGCLSQIQISA